MKATNKEKAKTMALELTEMRKNIQALSQLDREKQSHAQELVLNRMTALQDMMLNDKAAESEPVASN